MSANIEQIKAMLERTGKTNKQKTDLDKERLQLEATYLQKDRSKFVFPKFLYARTTNNKTIDVSYAPQSLDAVEYIRSDFLQQEQPIGEEYTIETGKHTHTLRVGSQSDIDNQIRQEKQKEQKPVAWSESDTLMCNAALELLRSHSNLMASHGINKSSVIGWLQSFRPQKQGFIDNICSKAGIDIPYLDGNQWCILKGDNIQAGVVGFGVTKEDALANFIKDVSIPQQWSEEDEDNLCRVIRALEDNDSDWEELSNWLKSLRKRTGL